MKILHVTEIFSQSGWGMTSALAELSTHLKHLGISQTILAPDNDTIIPPKGVELKPLHINPWLKSWRYPQRFQELFDLTVMDDSVVHLHGIWMGPQYMAARRAIQSGIPFVLSPHNMLGSWAINTGFLRRLKKTIYWKMTRSCFTQVRALHALTPLERDSLHKYFPGKTIAIIPNGVDLNVIDSFPISRVTPSGTSSLEKYILILGRLAPVKGIEIFLEAFARLHPSKRLPVILAGPPYQQSYLSKLQNLVRQHGLENDVTFRGPVFGQEKWDLLRNAFLVCAPSYTEGMSMVALESMASSVPIITTHAAGIPNVREGGGLLIRTDPKELYEALIQAIAWTEEERLSRGRQARRLVEKYYSWEVVGPQYLDFYRNLQ